MVVAPQALRMTLQDAELPQGQVETVEERMAAHPELAQLDLSTLIGDPSLQDPFLSVTGSEGLSADLAAQIGQDPALATQLNGLAANDPQAAAAALEQFQDNPAALATTLDSVTSEMPAATAASAEGGDQAMAIQTMMQDFGSRFDSMLGSIDGNNIGEMLQALVDMVYGFSGQLMTALNSSISSFQGSRGVIADGNGIADPDGPMQQAARAMGADPTVTVERAGGEPRTAPASEHTAPAADRQPAAPDPPPQAPLPETILT